MAEERCDALQQELDALKEKVEELTLDLEILRGEKEEEGGGGAAVATSSVEYFQLEKHNERLKEALVKLRDVANDEKADFIKKLKEAEKQAAEVPGLTAKVDKFKTECREYEEQVANLKEALDGALAAQEVVDRLSDKNLALEDKIQDLRTQLEDLEALRQLNEELEQGHLDTETQLQDEIEFKDNIIRTQTRTLTQTQETIADSENTIIKFRQLVRSLQSSLEQSQPGKEGGGANAEEGEAESQAMKSLRQELQTTTMKAQSKGISVLSFFLSFFLSLLQLITLLFSFFEAVALELRRLDAEQATDHLGYVLTFLPEKFFKGDHNCIRSTLAFKRIAFKTELIINHLEQTYSVSTGKKGSVDATEGELKFICEVCVLSSRHLSVPPSPHQIPLGFSSSNASAPLAGSLEGSSRSCRFAAWTTSSRSVSPLTTSSPWRRRSTFLWR